MRPKIIPEYVRLRERDETRRDVSGPIKGSIRTESLSQNECHEFRGFPRIRLAGDSGEAPENRAKPSAV